MLSQGLLRQALVEIVPLIITDQSFEGRGWVDGRFYFGASIYTNLIFPFPPFKFRPTEVQRLYQRRLV